jgi:hypothetical protein
MTDVVRLFDSAILGSGIAAADAGLSAIPDLGPVTDKRLTPATALSSDLTADEADFVKDSLARGDSAEGIAHLVAIGRGVSTFPDPSLLAPDALSDEAIGGGTVTAPDNSDLVQTGVFKQIRTLQRDFLDGVRSEFATFPPWVKDAFENEAENNGVSGLSAPGVSVPADLGRAFSKREVSYLVIRTLMWKDGYRQIPALFKDRIVQGTFLDQDIQFGVAQDVLDKLKQVEASFGNPKLEGLFLDESFLRPKIKTILGLQPRRIADKPFLSFHAFGSAVDIDAQWNPILDGPVSTTIQLRSDINFASEPIGPDGNIDEQILKLKAGSDKFRDWMKDALPKYRKLQSDIENAEKDVQDAQRNFDKAKPADKDVARKALDDATAQFILVQARSADLDIVDVEILRDAFPKPKSSKVQDPLDGLAQDGYLTLRYELVKALTDPNIGGFRWGGAWPGDRQDFMHFDGTLPKRDITN